MDSKESLRDAIRVQWIKKEMPSDSQGIYSNTEGEKPCPIKTAGQDCWGMVVHGTGCTNPDCPRNNLSGGF